MKKIKTLVVNIILVVTAIAVMSGCGKKATVPTSTEIKNKKVIEDKKENTGGDKSDTPTVEKNTQKPVETTPAVVQQNQSTTPTTPKANGKVIVIDPGHASRSNMQTEPQAPGSNVMKIKDGGGAQGISTRTPEYVVNMNVSIKLKKYLEEKGYTVIMTKIDNSLSLGNVERAEIWNNANAALAIRIHADSSENSSVKGASMLIPTNQMECTRSIYSESKRCGEIVLSNLVKEVGMANRGVVPHDDMTGFNWSRVPVILVEMGFLSNPDEDRLLSSSDYEDKIAKALADGIIEAVK